MLFSCHFQILHGSSKIWANIHIVSLQVGKSACLSEVAFRIWKRHGNDTHFHHHFYLKNANLTVHYNTGTHFSSQLPEFTVGDILWYVLKLWGQLVNLKWMICFNFLLFGQTIQIYIGLRISIAHSTQTTFVQYYKLIMIIQIVFTRVLFIFYL